MQRNQGESTHSSANLSRGPHADVTDAELMVLKALWKRGWAKIRELMEDLYPAGGTSNYATVQKLLERLAKKGCVEHRQEGRANVFRATVGRDELISHRLQATADSLCEGSLTPLLSLLVGGSRLSTDDVSTLRELVNQLDGKDGSSKGEEE